MVKKTSLIFLFSLAACGVKGPPLPPETHQQTDESPISISPAGQSDQGKGDHHANGEKKKKND